MINNKENKQTKGLLQSEIAYVLLFKCPNCGKIFKLVSMDEPYTCFTGQTYTNVYTDFGDKMKVVQIDDDTYFITTICCNEKVLANGKDLIYTEDWVADKVFTIKGS